MINSKREINKVFVLNLSSKNEKLKEKINNLNIPNKFECEIVLGIKGTNTKIKWKPFPTWELKNHSNFWWNRPLLEGEVGCSLGHYLMWKQAYEEGYELSLFLEEDFNVVHSLEKLDLSELPQDVDGFYLGRNKLNPNEVEEEVGENWFKASYSYNSQSYCLTRSGLEKILKYDFLNNIIPSDEFLPATYTEHPRKDVAETFKPTLNFYAHKIEHITQTSNENISQTENSEPLKEIRVVDYSITEKPKIYDCFLFDHELDMLNLRLHEMDESVDHFILIEARQSHTGKDKELYFQKHKDLFKKFKHKIEHVVIDLPNEVLYEPHPTPKNDEERLTWFRENYHRNAIKDVLYRISPKDNDIVLISDVDEIWDDDILRRLKHNQVSFDTFKTILQRWHYWSFKWDFENMYWPGPAFCKWSYLKTTTPQKIRNVRYEQETHLYDINGWHLSWFGDVEFNLHKLRNFAHQELNIYDKDSVNNMINNGYLFSGNKLTTLDWDYYPKYRNLIEDGVLYKNLSKSKKMLERNPPSTRYSQFDQDKYLIETFFKDKTDGVFLEVGCIDGIHYSNSLMFEEMGWNGLCIEPSPKTFKMLKQNRKCICENVAVSNVKGIAKFREITGYWDGLSGLVDKYDPRHPGHCQWVNNGQSNSETISYEQTVCHSEIIEVETETLSNLLEKHKLYDIDFATIDTEGGEYEILQGIDFDRFNIKVILVENNYSNDNYDSVRDLLLKNGYKYHTTLETDEVWTKGIVPYKNLSK